MYGNILGTNEIIGLMLQRDLIVLGLSDGVMCASTGFCWILQRLILAGYISWNGEGWIIQNVRCPRLIFSITGRLAILQSSHRAAKSANCLFS
jgi:hypothetical protein